MDGYEDIMHLSRPIPNRPRMSMIDRAAQFSPFAALTGYDAAIQETGRLTDARIELEEDAKARLSDRLQLLKESLQEGPVVQITYFVPDERKEGGAYVTETGVVLRIDEYTRQLILVDGKRIPLREVIQLDGAIFQGMEEGRS